MAAVLALDTPAVETCERLVGFVAGIVSGLGHVRQRENAGLYVRGLIEQGGRKSLQPTLFRLEESSARYESVQQFLADSPWDPTLVVRRCAERVVPELEVEAWVLDDTGFPKDGKHSPGVKRQYSGTLGKIGNCQIGVSVHAVGKRGTAPLGWALYLPEEWCADAERRGGRRSPRRSSSRPSRSLVSISSRRRPAGGSQRCRCWATRPTATTLSCANGSTTPSASTCSRSAARRRCSRPRPCSPSPS